MCLQPRGCPDILKREVTATEIGQPGWYAGGGHTCPILDPSADVLASTEVMSNVCP